MSRGTRRDFLQTSAGLLAAGAASRSIARGAESKQRIRVGFIGCGGQADSLMRSFAAFKDVEATHVCDVDSKHRAEAAALVEQVAGRAPKPVEDLREVLDDKSVDTVVIATPDHWHAPATILACEAGKHVYVEKPCSHNLREGRLMIEAARRGQRVVQLGTQSRSAPHVVRAIQLVRDGAIGEVLETKAWTNQMRVNIGHKAPTDPPPELNYDLWVGPAPIQPFRPNCHHYHWRWWRNFGTGDIGNDGVHELDIARWALGVETHPTRIRGMGGKYFFDDDQQFPDTYSVLYEYPPEASLLNKGGQGGSERFQAPGRGSERLETPSIPPLPRGADDGLGTRQLVFELRNWCPYPLDGYENGNAFYGTKGMMLLDPHVGWKIIGKDGKPGEQMKTVLDSSPHHRNFLDCIRSGARPNADIETGHLSSSLAHLGNIAVRVGRNLQFDGKREMIIEDAEAAGMLQREYREGHWAVPKAL